MKRVLTEKQLLDRLEALPREITPGQDVWPDISARIDQRPATHAGRHNAWWFPAVAASIAVALITGVLLVPHWGVKDLDSTSAELVVQQPLRTENMSVVLKATEREYLAAFREFGSVGDFQDTLPPLTVEKLFASWADMKDTEASLSGALLDNPGNDFLIAKMLKLRSHQLDFLRQLASLDRDSRRTTT